MNDRYHERRQRLRRGIEKAKADALLVTSFTNVTYLTGFTGDDSYLFVRSDGETLISDPRYTTQLEEECPGLDLYIRKPGSPMLDATRKVLRRAGLKRIAVEGDSITVGFRDQLSEKLPGVELVTANGLVERLRAIKDRNEVAQIRQAIWQAEKAFAVVKAALRPEKTEKQVADELENEMRGFGAVASGFPSIVAVGPRAALPHAKPGDRKVGSSFLLLVDWGANGGLYKSDLTRVLVAGKIPPKLERIYRVVLSAQQEAIAAIRDGIAASKVDKIARDVIAEAGFGRRFKHGLGHGLGLEVHEAPRLAAKVRGDLRAGMVVTVEPGIYLPGWGGVRIEDDVLVTRRGHEVLTSAPKTWEEAIVG